MTELKPSELKLLKLVCQDNSNVEIAEKMKLSQRYTEKIKSSLFKKTKTKSNVGLLKWALINGLYTLKRK